MKKTFLSILFVLALCLCLSPMALATGGYSVTYITADGSADLSYESDGTTNLLQSLTGGTASLSGGTYYLLGTPDNPVSDLTFTGDTTLYLAANLNVTNSLTFNGNALVILGDGATLTVNGVLSCTGNLTITTVTGATNTALTVTGGTRTDGNGYGIYSGGSLCIYAGTVEATDADTTADKTNSYGIYVARGSLIISGGSTSVTATGGTAKGESHGIYQAEGYTNGSVSITDSTVEAFGGTATDSSTGIRIRNNPLSISGNAKVTAKGGKAAGSRGIHCTEYLTISGNAEVTAESGSNVTEGYGIHGIENVTINGGKVTATAGAASSTSCGIYADGLSITSGTVKATGGTATSANTNTYSYGICAEVGVISIVGGSVTAVGDTATGKNEAYSYGIYANSSVDISDSTVTAYSGTATASLYAYSYGICAKGFGGSSVESNKIIINQTEGKTTTLYGKDSGPVSLSAYSLTYNGGGLELATDSTFTKWLLSDVRNQSFLPILPTGYTFVWISDENPVVKLEPKAGAIGSGVITLSVCDHKDNNGSSARENGICKYCGGAGALVKNNTSGIEYENFALAYNAAKNGETIALLSNVSDALTINDSGKKITLDLNGHDATGTITVSVPATITDSVGNGTITTLTTSGDVKIGGLLAAGYGFKSSSAWYDGSSEETSVSNVTVKKVPFKDLTITAVTNVTGDQTAGFRWDYGKNASFSLCATDNITASSGDTAVTLSGRYALKQNGTVKADGTISVTTPGESWIAGASHFDGTEDLAQAAPLQISGTLLPAGSYTLEITVTADAHDYSQTISIPVTMNKGTMTAGTDYGTPDPMTALTYNAQEQVLVSASAIRLPTGAKYLYSLDKINWKENVSEIKGKDAKSYTVYWMVDGGDNYNDVTNTQPLTATIAKKNISAGMETRIVYVSIPDLPFIGQPQTPTPVLQLKSKGDNGSEVVLYETLKKDIDYTVTVTPQTNVGGYELTLTGTGNYTGTRTGSWSISKAPAPTLRDIPVSQKYTVTGEQSKQLGNLMPADAGTLSYSEGTPTMPDTAAVTGFTVSETGLMKYTLSGIVGNVITLPVKISSTNYADATVNVVVTLTEKDTQAALTITSPNTATYRTTLQLMESGGSGSGRVSWSVVDGTGSAVINNGSILYPTKAGTVIVTATKAGDNSYNEISSEPMTITIAPLQISGEPLYTPITTGGKTLKDAALRRNDSWYKFSSLFGWVGKDGNPLPDSTEVQQNTAYTWRLLLDESEAGNCTPMLLSGEIVLWSKSAPPASNGKHHITVDDAENGSVSVEPSGAKAGETVTITVKPDAGYAVEDITITDRNGNKVKLTRKGDKYTFEMPETGVTVKVEFARSGNPFVDVPADKYFYDAVLWAVENGITGGVDETHFDPYASCTRGQLVTFLWRAAGCPAAKDSKGFADVAAGRYCDAAVAWAAENGIVGGYDDGSFRPDATITRQQTAAILWRFAKYAGMDVTVGEDTNILSFSDALSISDYAVPAIQWAVGAEVMGGSNGSLLPGNVCNRAQIVTMLYRSIAE